MKSKVFCIGFHKTGTTSLAVALKKLGYKVTGPNGVNDPDIAHNALNMATRLATKYDAFQDNPWPLIYREMDTEFPGSKFILTLRDPEAWIVSQVRHFGRNETPMRKWIYGVGCPQGNEDIYIRRFTRHNEDVCAYFTDRPRDLLVIDVSKGEGWEKLCPFLGVGIRDDPFPHVNRAVSRQHGYASNSLLARRLKSMVNRFLRQLA